MTPWLNILVSAVVAAVVTLSIEYAAKPWLEARKERILEGARRRREVELLLNLAHSNVGMYADFVRGKPSDGSPEEREIIDAHLDRLKEEIGEQGHEIVKRGRLLASEDLLFFEVVSIVAGTLAAISSTGLMHVKEEEVDQGVGLALELLRDKNRRDSGLRRASDSWIGEQLPSRRASSMTSRD